MADEIKLRGLPSYIVNSNVTSEDELNTYINTVCDLSDNARDEIRQIIRDELQKFMEDYVGR